MTVASSMTLSGALLRPRHSPSIACHTTAMGKGVNTAPVARFTSAASSTLIWLVLVILLLFGIA